MMDKFNLKYPNYKIVLMMGNCRKLQYPYVNQLSLNEINEFILTREGFLEFYEIKNIVEWLTKNPTINTYKGFNLWKMLRYMK